jgi:hypothetical protein
MTAWLDIAIAAFSVGHRAMTAGTDQPVMPATGEATYHRPFAAHEEPVAVLDLVGSAEAPSATSPTKIATPEK